MTTAFIFTTITLSSWANAASGSEIFIESCEGCHSGGISGFFMGSPAIGDKDDWAPLAAKGMPTLLKNTKEGLGSMSEMGGCDSCTDEELTSAIEYILSKSK
jgi:cytochrome c5